MSRHRTHTLICIALACLVSGLPVAAQAQAFPNRPIKLIVPYAPGGLPDSVARVVAQRLQESLGQAVVIENKPGGNGGVAATALATAPADGHTLLVTDGSMLTINPLLSTKLGYDPAKDFLPVSLIAESPLFLAVHPKTGVKTLDELIALAKTKPGALNYGSSGIGSSHHLSTEAMKAGFGVFITHIPYRGSANSVPALIGGQVDMVFSAYPSLAGFVKGGQAVMLATNGAKRSNFAPDVPAIAEKLPGFNFAVMVVMLAPKGTPAEVVQKLSAEVTKIAQRPDVIAQLQGAGIEAIGGTPDQLAAALRAESQRVAAAAKRANLNAD